jgi:hypothetical protein
MPNVQGGKRPPRLFFAILSIPLLMFFAYLVVDMSLDTAHEATAAQSGQHGTEPR